MKEGLILFGGINSSFLATSYPNVRICSCDDYNNYHLQVCIMCFCAISLQLCNMKLILQYSYISC